MNVTSPAFARNETTARRKPVAQTPAVSGPYFLGSNQVALLGLEGKTDRELWAYARANDFVLVSRDADFYEISLHLGQPPKLIWLRLGNCDKAAVIRALTENQEEIEVALLIEGKACIEIA